VQHSTTGKGDIYNIRKHSATKVNKKTHITSPYNSFLLEKTINKKL
jgi:hypothetical protein